MACESAYISHKIIIEIYIYFQNTDHEDETDVSTNDNDALRSADAIVVIRGQKEDDFTYSKTAAIQVCVYQFWFVFIIGPSVFYFCRLGYLDMKCMMYLLYFAKIQ